MRRAARVDANQQAIVEALRAAGAYVWIIGLVPMLLGVWRRWVSLWLRLALLDHSNPAMQCNKPIPLCQNHSLKVWAHLCKFVVGPESYLALILGAERVFKVAEPFHGREKRARTENLVAGDATGYGHKRAPCNAPLNDRIALHPGQRRDMIQSVGRVAAIEAHANGGVVPRVQFPVHANELLTPVFGHAAIIP
jgi:hypothetical protein